MRISTEIGSLAKHVGEEEAIRLVAEAGFDAFDFSLFRMISFDWSTLTIRPGAHPLGGDSWREFARRIRRTADECGIVCNQSHAPFPTRGEAIMPYLFRAIECTAIAGGDLCVIHPDNDKSVEENAEIYARLLPFAKECGVRIAAENMWNRDNVTKKTIPAACSHHEDFLRHIEAVGDPYLVACLDVGHAEMEGLDTSIGQMIKTLGPHLAALHLHDNDGVDDRHALPFSMDINFTSLIKHLVLADYRGDLTLEADSHLAGFTPETVGNGVREMQAAAARLRTMFEGFTKLRAKH